MARSSITKNIHMTTSEETPQLKPPAWAIGLAFGIVFFSWGTTYLATSIAMKDEKMPPGLFGGFRLLTAGTILLLCQLARGQSLRLTGGECLRIFIISSFLFLSSNFLISY